MLQASGQPQRFGTHLTSDGGRGKNYVLDVVTPGPSDAMRRLFGADSRARLKAKTTAWRATFKG